MLKFSQNAFRKNTLQASSRRGSKCTLRNWLRSVANKKARIFLSLTRVLMYKVKAQVNRTAYRSCHNTEEVTRVAHVKANPATNEVRRQVIENCIASLDRHLQKTVVGCPCLSSLIFF